MIFPVVAGDEMKEVQASFLVRRRERVPIFVGVGIEQIAPEFIDEFDAERDVAKHFAMDAVDLSEAKFRVGIFPKFAAVMKEDAAEEEVAIELRVDRRDGSGRAHHLSDVFDESASARVVIAFGRGGAGEAFAHLREE